ncbi:PQQ-binding-like beta-propeller repeat protein [Pelagibacteraceae bacterium]|nr:PQQ-binding-like beta-propeller repeat protein [Pelagibacteraceae bacterium]
MKKLLLVFTALALCSCSFDNKTGIWRDASTLPVENKTSESISENLPEIRYENIFSKNKLFNEEKDPDKFINVEVDEPIRIVNWPEQYAVPTNNISNYSHSANRILVSKSSKLSKNLSSKNNSSNKIIFYQNNLVSYDHKGIIFIYSLSLNKKIFEFNFYKKNFKKFNKKINLIINENILYASDNLGYLYALNLSDKSILWAKNYGIPFRSNIKFVDNQIFLANQDNVILSIDSNTGEKNWQFATSPTFLKTDFENNFALDVINNNILFLNTTGELYSINYLSQNINWVLNFKNYSLAGEAGDTELFISQPLVIKNNNLIITTEKNILSYNLQTAFKNWSFSANPIFKPIITFSNTFVLLKENLLICLDNLNGNVIWSKNILKNIENKNIKDDFGSLADFKIVNNKINIYSKNGNLLSFNPSNGDLTFFSKINKSGIRSEIFFLNDKMLFVDNKNKLLKFN